MKHLNKYKKLKINHLFVLVLLILSLFIISLTNNNKVYAIPRQAVNTSTSSTSSSSSSSTQYQCGEGPNAVQTSIDLGCTRKGNPILDMLFAAIRFLSAGVGVVVVFSTILAGIQYTTSRDNPESTQKAKGRLISNVIALVVFVFAYSILNFLIPGGFFNG
jgi:hypothetical protein